MEKEKLAKLIAWVQESPIVVLGERVLVARDEAQKETAGGLVIPETYQHPEKAGTIVALGEEVEPDRIGGLAPGNRVIFTTYNAVKVQIPWPDGEPVALDIFHYRDLYIGVQDDTRVEVATNEQVR